MRRNSLLAGSWATFYALGPSIQVALSSLPIPPPKPSSEVVLAVLLLVETGESEKCGAGSAQQRAGHVVRVGTVRDSHNLPIENRESSQLLELHV